VEDSAIVALVASFIGGFAMQYLRGFKWFGDGNTHIVALAGGILTAWLTGAIPGTPIEAVPAVMQHTLTILGGTMVGHTTAQVSTAVPKFNQYK